jgi:membrane protein implicated in regulation of membrane protease activity
VNSYTIFWLLFAVVLGVIEAATPTLTTIWLAIGALVVAVISALEVSFITQIFVFAVCSAVLVLLTRPLVKKFVARKIVATNADRIISLTGIVIEDISAINHTGLIKVMGQTWSAKSLDGEDIPQNTEVVVNHLEGVRAVVKRAGCLQEV